MTLQKSIALSIEICLERNQWTKIHLCKIMGIRPSYLQCLLKGRKGFTTERITQVSRIFGMQEWELIRMGQLYEREESSAKENY